jgi:hypothetical protein
MQKCQTAVHNQSDTINRIDLLNKSHSPLLPVKVLYAFTRTKLKTGDHSMTPNATAQRTEDLSLNRLPSGDKPM